MAGDWLKMRLDLADDPAVIGIANATDLDEYGVVGRLHKLWSWADRQSRDGHAQSVTKKWVDRYLERDGFAQAMVDVGWLVFDKTGLMIPKFDRHNGKGAKNRALSKDRKVTQRSRSERDTNVTREEKRREESKPSTSLRSVDHIPEPLTLTPTEKPKPVVTKGTAEKPSIAAWNAYEASYRERYGVSPVRNAKVNGQLARLVERLGAEASVVAAFYVGHNNALYVRARHPVDLLLQHAEGLRTQWATGRKATTAEAREAERGDELRGQVERVEEILRNGTDHH